MSNGELGRIYHDGEVIVKQGEVGDCMYVILEGQVEVVYERNGREIHLAYRTKDDYFGEMALFEKEVRMATVRAAGSVRLLTIDRKNLMRHISANPSLALRMLETMSKRLRELSEEVAQFKGSQ
jgi:CRP-like cAMP-binding protein